MTEVIHLGESQNKWGVERCCHWSRVVKHAYYSQAALIRVEEHSPGH